MIEIETQFGKRSFLKYRNVRGRFAYIAFSLARVSVQTRDHTTLANPLKTHT